ncbi:MAG: hypothetical protein IK033_07800, partial [Verrucomicrobia bacterium]|nr:hypothetical protein [Verrucomicrobiota bacterium]
PLLICSDHFETAPSSFMPSPRSALPRGGFRRCERLGQPELSELSSGSVAGIVGVASLVEMNLPL